MPQPGFGALRHIYFGAHNETRSRDARVTLSIGELSTAV